MKDIDSVLNNYDPSLHHRVKRLLNRKAAAEKQLETAEHSYRKLLNGSDRRKEIKLPHAMSIVKIHEKTISSIKDEMAFLRPREPEDMSYRLRQYEEFSSSMSSILPDDLPLRFHGCPIYAAQKIIQSGEISSSVDRLGVQTSYDGEGQISVTTKDTLDTTIRSYTCLTGDYDLPGGCVFVVTPENKYDELLGLNNMMGNVDFKQDPDRLVSVITTPENVERVKGWLKQAGLSSDKVYDFDGFINSIDRVISSVHIPYLQGSISHAIANGRSASRGMFAIGSGKSLNGIIADAEKRRDSKAQEHLQSESKNRTTNAPARKDVFER